MYQLLRPQLFLLIGALLFDGSHLIDPRIIGGYMATIKDVNYLVQVSTNDQICGGSLISTRWVISAAHCVQNVKVADLKVLGGTSLQGDPNAVRRSVDLVVTPPNFSMKTMHMDVAALMLDQDMVGTNIGTIKLASQMVPAGGLVKVSGWGSVSPKSSQTAKHLHSVVMPMWSPTACQSAYRGLHYITKSMVCAGLPNRRDSCDGDSGGPVVYRGELVGIVSFGMDQCATRLPGVYTSVPMIRRWFLDMVQQFS